MAAVWDHSMTITGDKRALTALALLSKEVGLVDKLSGRLKCLEQTIAEMMLAGYSGQVISKVHGQSWDTALRICFNSADSDNALECLSSYYKDINVTCLNMLAPFPDT